MQCMAEQLKKAFPVRKGPPLRLAQGTVTNRVQRLKFEKFRIAGACGRSGSQWKGRPSIRTRGVIVSGTEYKPIGDEFAAVSS